MWFPWPASSGHSASSGRTNIIIAEFVAIVIGWVLINAAGKPQYVCPWVAFVGGAHFLVFGRIL